MPPIPKPWQSFPSISTQIDAGALIGMEVRDSNYVGSSEIGVGVGAQPDFQVTQAGGGSLTVNVGPSTGGLQRAFLPGDTNGGTQRWEYAGAQLTATVAAADPTNPRIDLITLAPNANIDSAVPQVLVVKGTATAGATLANRTGAPALPAGRILLADVLVAAGGTTILTAAIRDRRSYPFAGVNPGVFSSADLVIPEQTGGVQQVTTGAIAGTNDNRTAAILMWLPRRIFASRIVWKYRQGTTPAITNYQWVIADASGRQVAATALTAFTGGASAGANPNVALVAPVQLEAGAYWMGFQVASMTASAAVTYLGYQGVQNGAAVPGVSAQNLYAFAAGVVLGTASSAFGTVLSDAYSVVADTAALPVPAFSIGA